MALDMKKNKTSPLGAGFVALKLSIKLRDSISVLR